MFYKSKLEGNKALDKETLSKIYIVGVLATFIVSLNVSANANPWLDTGDMRLRHELQILSDSGVLDAPLTTWPLVSKDIYERLKQPANGMPMDSGVLEVLNNINQRLVDEDYGSSFKITGAARTKELLIRDFSGEGREKGLVSYDGQWGSPVVDLRLKATLADKSNHPDDDTFRLDESYISSALGNWRFTVGKQSRWWGPGWDGSLILSNNARPIPSLSVENVSSEAFDNKYLKWMGPNKLHFFIGQLESDRGVPDAKLIGTRLTLRPLKSLEIGLHRTIQWGGDGQDESFSSLIKTIASVRVDEQDGSLGSVRGNQIAGLDFRWKLPVSSKEKYSLYGQYIGEDRVDGSLLLGDETFLLGGSISGLSKKLGGSWRAYLEATDTSAASFKGRDRNNIIYNHGAYTDGYRYQDLSMGHGIDSDSRIISAGAMLSRKNGDFWRGWVKQVKLNEDGIGQNPLAPNGKKWSAIGVSLDRKFDKQTRLNLGAQFISEKENGKSRENELAVSLGFSRSF